MTATIIRYTRNGPDGVQNRYRVRGNDTIFEKWLLGKELDPSSDFPWYYFSLTDEHDRELQEKFEIFGTDEHDDSPYAAPRVPTETEKLLSEEILKERAREMWADFRRDGLI